MFRFHETTHGMRLSLWAYLFTVLLLGLAFVCNPAAVSAAEGEQGQISFRWAFGALVGAGNDRSLTTVDRDMVLKSGDELKMLVVPQTQCFVYVIHHSDDGEMKMLFPYSLDQFDSDYELNQSYYIPRGDEWFALDKTVGRETFYLIASSQRLTDLEGLITSYESAGKENRPEVAKQVVAEIQKVKRQNRQLATAAERPVTIGGNVRGLAKPQGTGVPDVADIAVEITGTDFYAKTFSIEHQ